MVNKDWLPWYRRLVSLSAVKPWRGPAHHTLQPALLPLPSAHHLTYTQMNTQTHTHPHSIPSAKHKCTGSPSGVWCHLWATWLYMPQLCCYTCLITCLITTYGVSRVNNTCPNHKLLPLTISKDKLPIITASSSHRFIYSYFFSGLVKTIKFYWQKIYTAIHKQFVCMDE